VTPFDHLSEDSVRAGPITASSHWTEHQHVAVIGSLTEVKIRILDYANGRSRQMSELRYLDVPNFALQKGTVLPVARLVYRTLGTLNPAKDNAVLLTTGIAP
jgi:hypothetical protein